MTIKTILGENGPQSQLCSGSQCPAAIVADDGNIYIQGYLPTSDAERSLSSPAGEGFVCMPIEVAKKIAAQVVKA